MSTPFTLTPIGTVSSASRKPIDDVWGAITPDLLPARFPYLPMLTITNLSYGTNLPN